MKLSILIPVYNVENYIHRCLCSLYNQINDECEVILVDDGCTDTSGKICDEYKEKYPKVTKVFHKDNQGAYPTRNYALDEAIGEYIWLIDPDDYIEKGIIKKLFDDSHFQDGDIDIITMAYQRFNDKEVHKVENSYEGMPVISGRDYLLTKEFNPYLWCNLYSREFLVKNKLRFDDRLYSQGDWVFNIQSYVKAQKMLLTNFLGYHYYKGNPTSTLAFNDEVHRKRNANNSIIAITDGQEILNGIEDPKVIQVIKNRVDFISCGFIFALFTCNFPVKETKEYLKLLSEMGVYPIKSKLKNKANLFKRFSNLRFLFLFICWIRNRIYPYYSTSKLF